MVNSSPKKAQSAKANVPAIGILLPFKATRFLFGVLLLGVIFSGCSTSTETIIRDKKVSVEVPAVVEEITTVETRNFDSSLVEYIGVNATDSTYYEAHTITEKGVEVKAKLYLKDKDTQKPKLELEVKQPDVIFSYTDTTKHTTVKEANSPVDYLIYLIILAVVIAAVIIFIKLRN